MRRLQKIDNYTNHRKEKNNGSNICCIKKNRSVQLSAELRTVNGKE